MMSVFTLNYLLATGTILVQVFVVAALVDLLFARGQYLVRHIAPHALLLAFLAALGASVLTLVYELAFGVVPCPLCWWQRVFLYPQVILFGLALWRPDRHVVDYALVLSVLGAGVALYHHALQIFPGSLPCPADALCMQRHIFEFGYITFPLMAFTIFALLIVFFIAAKRTA
jgi:disulfide bond formation protein DsbB